MGKYDKAPTLASALIRLARQKAGLTQHELAEAAGMSQQAISAYETGRKDPTVSTLQRLLAGGGLEMRIRLEPVDRHDDALRAFLETLPSEVQVEIEEQQRRRVEQARLAAVRGR